jgi:hypothetical protein
MRENLGKNKNACRINKDKKIKKPDRPKPGLKNKTEEDKLNKNKGMKLNKEPAYNRPKKKKIGLRMNKESIKKHFNWMQLNRLKKNNSIESWKNSEINKLKKRGACNKLWKEKDRKSRNTPKPLHNVKTK